MAENDSYQIDKLLPFKTKPNTRAYIKEGDLQLHVSHPKDASRMEASSLNFQEIYAHYKNEATQSVQTQATGQTIATEDVRQAMEEAKSTFDSMMQIREQISQAYKELMQLQ